MARRQVNIFINGRQVENTLKGIRDEKRKVTRELNNMTIGSKEYNQKVAELKRLDGTIKQHREQIGRTSRSWKSGAEQLKKFAGVAAAAFAVREIVQYGVQVFKLGVEMEQLERKAKAVFGDVLPQVTAEAEKNATAMGLTTIEYVNAAAAMQDLLIPMGFQREQAVGISTDLVNLSGALSEWTGGQRSAEEVTKILGKALLGEREQLKELGISIQEADVKARLAEKGLQGLTGELLQQAKAAATLELITEKSADAQAAYADNSDSLIRRQAELTARFKELQERIATGMIPVWEKLVVVGEAVGQVVGAVSFLIKKYTGDTDTLVGIVDNGTAAMESHRAKLWDLTVTYNELSTKANLTLDEQTQLNKVMQDIGTIAPGAVSELDKYGNVVSINTDAVSAFITELESENEILRAETENELTDNITKWEELRGEKLENIKAGAQLSGSLADEQSDIQDYTKKIDEARAALVKLKIERGEIKITQSSGLDRRTLFSGFQGNQDGAGDGEEDPEINYRKLTNAELKRLVEEHNDTMAELEIARRDRAAKAAAKERDRAKKAADKLIEDQQKAQEKALDSIDKFLNDAESKRTLAALEEREQQREEIRRTFAERFTQLEQLEIEDSQRKIDLKTKLEHERRAALDALEAQFEEEDKTKKAEAQALINEEILSERELEKLELQQHFDALIELAEAHGLDVEALRQAHRERLAEIDQQHREKDLAAEKKLQDEKDKIDAARINAEQAVQDATVAAYSQGAAALSQIAGDNSQIQDALFIFQKGIAVADVIVNLQREIAAINASSALLGPAGIAIGRAQTIAAKIRAGTSIGTIAATTIAKFKKPSTQQRFMGGYTDVVGATDGKTYNAEYLGPRSTGMLPAHPNLVLASEKGPEYFVSHQDLQKPRVASFVRAIDNISKSGTPQFQEGGSTTGDIDQIGPPEASESPEVMIDLKNILMDIKENGLEANIPDRTIIDIMYRAQDLRRANGGQLPPR